MTPVNSKRTTNFGSNMIFRNSSLKFWLKFSFWLEKRENKNNWCSRGSAG